MQTLQERESQIESINSNNDTWVQKNSKHVEKNTLKKHLDSASHKKAAYCKKRKNLGIEKHTEKVIDETPIGKGLKRMGTDGKKVLVIKLNTAYCLAKNERPFGDYPGLVELQEKNEVRDIRKVYLTDKKCAEFTKHITHAIRTELDNDLKNCNYFTCLKDRSTDSSITEQEVICVP